MSIFENISMALASLRSNKMRALLTMLGIIIGIGSVIAILTLGNSLTSYIGSSMQDLGASNITIMLQSRNSETAGNRVNLNIPEESLITDDMLEEMRARFPNEVGAVSVSTTVGAGRTTYGARYANLTLIGASTDYVTANNLEMVEGRFLNEADNHGFRKVVVVSDKLAANMFPGESPLGQQITLSAGNHQGTYTIVGVYKYQTFSMGGMNTAADADVMTDAYIPLQTARGINGVKGYPMVTVLTASGASTAQLTVELEAFFSKYYANNPDYQVSVFNMEDMLATMTDMLNTVQIAVAAIAAISLLVGGIGVMNIMMVSITERTREIGTRKAIGATNTDIRMQFITEAVIMCLIGGIIGIVVGILLGMFGASLLGAPARASIGTIVFATAFSMAIGVFFGYYPANKAAKMDPIDALRYE